MDKTMSNETLNLEPITLNVASGVQDSLSEAAEVLVGLRTAVDEMGAAAKRRGAIEAIAIARNMVGNIRLSLVNRTCEGVLDQVDEALNVLRDSIEDWVR